MIQSIKVTNPLDESLELLLTEPEKSGFIIRSIEGLGPVKADLHMTELATLDGSIDNSARLGTRNIVLSLEFLGTPTIEDTRLKSYRFWPVKQNVTFEIETDNRHCYTVGRVESNTPSIFEKNEGCQISIMCPNSYFQELADTSVNFSSAVSNFEFPFDNDSLEQLGKNLLVNNRLRWLMNGVEFDILSNDTIQVQGRATKDINVRIGSGAIPKGQSRYMIEGCPAGGSNDTYSLALMAVNDRTILGYDTGNGLAFTVSSGSERSLYPLRIIIKQGIYLNDIFRPVLRHVEYVDGLYYPYGDNLIEYSTMVIEVNDATCTINADKTITLNGTPTDDIDLEIANITNIPNGPLYILSGSPEVDGCTLAIKNMANEVEVENDSTTGSRFYKTDTYKFYTVNLIVKAGTVLNNVVYKPMIRLASNASDTYEAHKPIIDNGPLLEFGNILAVPAGNVFYNGDAETGAIIELHAIGNVKGIGIYRFDTEEMMTISDDRLVSLTGSRIMAGDQIIINTVKGSKSIYLLRNGIYYNILNALNPPITWFQLRRGDNGFTFNATEGVYNLQYRISYKVLYEGV